MSLWKNIVFGYDKKRTHGSAQWADSWEKRKVLSANNKGLFIADSLRLDLKTSCAHLVLIAPTRAGKTSRYILNNALRKWPNPVGMVYFDPSGEIYQQSANWHRKQGFQVRKVNLDDYRQSEQFNPLLFVRNKNDARLMAQALVEGVYRDGKEDKFWTESAISITTLLILAVVQKIPLERRTLFFLNTLANKFGHAQDEINSLMEIALNEPDFEEYTAFLSQSTKVKQSIISTVKSALFTFGDPVLQHICEESTFDFLELRQRKTVLYLIQREDKIPFYKAFWSIFFQQLFEALMIGEGNHVFLMLDEFASYNIPNFHNIISVIAKRRTSVSVILQSFQQLYSAYGRDKAQIILDNLNSKIILPGLPAHSAEVISRSLGTTTEIYTPNQADFFDTTAPKQRISRPLMNPDEVRTLKEGYCLFLSGRYNPMKLKMAPYFKNRLLKRRTKL